MITKATVSITDITKVPTEKLVTFTPSVGFTGYPADVKTKFTAGKESVPVPASFLEMVRAKGLVSEPVQQEGKA